MNKDMKAFMEKAGQKTKYTQEQINLYASLIEEEALEFREAHLYHTLANELKELTDVLVVTLGAIWSMGVDPKDAWDLVHKNNMLKVSSGVTKDSTGKIMKSKKSIEAKAKMIVDLNTLLKEANSGGQTS